MTRRDRTVDETPGNGHLAVATAIKDNAYGTGTHRFFLALADLLGLGFQLRQPVPRPALQSTVYMKRGRLN